jgi:hypothetical protein
MSRTSTTLINALLTADWQRVLLLLARLIPHFRLQSPQGLYEVLKQDVCLELLDEGGTEAIYRKQQQVRFRQDNIIAYQDMAWGEGDIFAAYHCSPGVAVDRYREGHRWHVLISLRQTKNRGDVEEFQIERHITDGFTQASEDLQTEVNHKMGRLSVSVIFPQQRLPKSVSGVEQNSRRTHELTGANATTLPDGRVKYRWEIAKPRLYEAYIIAWKW